MHIHRYSLDRPRRLFIYYGNQDGKASHFVYYISNEDIDVTKTSRKRGTEIDSGSLSVCIKKGLFYE